MKRKKFPKPTGIALAIASAGLVAGVITSLPAMTEIPEGTRDLIHCYGVNACGGHNDCKGADNACAGKASCKGTGFVSMPSKVCSDVGGKQKDEWVGHVDSADFIHCYGVNVCGGHNDCKGADNACAAKASCKGTGFVNMPAKACTDIGGKSGA